MPIIEDEYGGLRESLLPGDARRVLRHADDEIQRGDRVVLACRVSERVQNHRGNLNDSERSLRKYVAARGATVVGVVRTVGSGQHATWVRRGAELCKEHGAKLLAESTDRLIRSARFDTEDAPDAQANDQELGYLNVMLDGVVAATVLPPDAPARNVRSFQRRRGQVEKGAKGGRPRNAVPGYKKQRRLEKLPEVLQLHAAGQSLGQIEDSTGVPKQTVREWIKKSAEGVDGFCLTPAKSKAPRTQRKR
jgi:hypothetical protein